MVWLANSRGPGMLLSKRVEESIVRYDAAGVMPCVTDHD